jgi:nucleoside-diphosphate-sugar epimerase
MSTDDQLVLVTGANGFVATHCIVELLRGGYRVRGTLRSAEQGKKVRDAIAKHANVSGLSFVEADLNLDNGWDRAVEGCTYVLHVASPVPRQAPKDPQDVIRPAHDGTLRVLKAATRARVKRVVMTSSTAAIFYGHERDGSKVYTEADWSILSDEVSAYDKSKTLAERAAWEYVRGLTGPEQLELVVLNPGLILGPLLMDNASISGEVVLKLLKRELPGCPDLGFAPVDVRDLAAMEVRAMTVPQAAGERFILALEHTPMLQIAEILARHYGPRGLKVPTRRVPSWVLKCVALFDKTVAVAVPELGKRQDVTCAHARDVLNFTPRSLETMVLDMAESMLALGLVPAPKRKSGAPASVTESA